MGLFPPDRESWERMCPDWAKELMELRIPHVVGLPVYDVLYCGMYGYPDGWIVTAISDDGTSIHAERDRAECGALSTYFVADVRTEIGRKHVDAWKTRHTP